MTEPRCDHQHRSRIGGACAPCFLAHWSEKLPVGTFVTYDDEEPRVTMCAPILRRKLAWWALRARRVG